MVLFWSGIIGKTIKTPGFNVKTRLICPLLTEMRYWQIKPSEKGKHTNKRDASNILFVRISLDEQTSGWMYFWMNVILGYRKFSC